MSDPSDLSHLSRFWPMAERLTEVAQIAFDDDGGEDGTNPKPESVEFRTLRSTILERPAATYNDMWAKVFTLRECGEIGMEASRDDAFEQHLIAERRLDTLYDAVSLLEGIVADLEAGRPVKMALKP